MSDYFAPLAPDGFGQLRLAGGDSRLWVKFERRSRKNAYKSELEGRPIYEPIDYVKIQQPGEKDQWVGPATEAHKMRFPQQWDAYQRQVEQVPEGTPVQLLFPNEPHITELMLDLKIMTIEQLANLTEQAIERLGMDGRKYVNKATQAMEKSEALREVTRLQHVVDGQADQIDVLKTGMDRQRVEIEALRKMMEEARASPLMERATQLFGMQQQPLDPRHSQAYLEQSAHARAIQEGGFELPPPRVPLVD